LSPADGGNLVGQPQKETFDPGSTLPRQFVFYHYPNEADYVISPEGHPNTLALKGASANLTLPDFSTDPEVQSVVTFIARRQDHVLFTAESTIDFTPQADGEEAGMSMFLSRAQHYDFGVVGLNNFNGTSGLKRYIRLLTITFGSSDAGASDPVSKPGMLPLPDTTTPLRLRVEASRSTFTFSYQEGSNDTWVTVGTGDATELSGGFTGVRPRYYYATTIIYWHHIESRRNVRDRQRQTLHLHRLFQRFRIYPRSWGFLKVSSTTAYDHSMRYQFVKSI
jgi:beta-xylosidase